MSNLPFEKTISATLHISGENSMNAIGVMQAIYYAPCHDTISKDHRLFKLVPIPPHSNIIAPE